MAQLTRRPRRRHRAALSVAIPLLALGCAGELTGIAGASGVTVATGGSAATAAVLDPALFGHWRRTIVFQGVDGSTNSSETTWSFDADGVALRAVVARNLTYGYADAVRALARWRVDGGTVVITFQPPDVGTVRFTYGVDRRGGDLLLLGNERYRRVGF